MYLSIYLSILMLRPRRLGIDCCNVSARKPVLFRLDVGGVGALLRLSAVGLVQVGVQFVIFAELAEQSAYFLRILA